MTPHHTPPSDIVLRRSMPRSLWSANWPWDGTAVLFVATEFRGNNRPIGDRAVHFNGSARYHSIKTPQSNSVRHGWGWISQGTEKRLCFAACIFSELWIAPPSHQPLPHHNQPVYAGTGAGTAGGCHGGFVFTSGFWTIFRLGGRIEIVLYHSKAAAWRASNQ